VTGSRASRPRVLSACELRPSAREEKVFSTDRSPIVNFTLKNSYSQSTRRWPFFKFHFVRNRSPYRWWKRIRFAIEDELKEVGNAGMDDRLRRVTFDPILFAMAKEQKRQRKADKVAQKKEIDELEGERHRLRVAADRWRLERADAMLRTGYSPGERSFTNDWIFWHGFDLHDMEGERDNTGHSRRNAEHGCGCGGSQEWIARLKKHRSEINKKIAERHRAMTAVVRGNAEKKPASGDDTTKRPKKKNETKFQEIGWAISVQHRRRCNGGKSREKPHVKRRSLCGRHMSFEAAPNKCLQKSLLTLARDTSPQVYAVLLRMFRASCGNGSTSGAGSGRESAANLYATEHALRYIGAYALVHLPLREEDSSTQWIQCWKIGSGHGYCIGGIEWDFDAHHARPSTQRSLHSTCRLASPKLLRPWEQGYVGASKTGNTVAEVPCRRNAANAAHTENREVSRLRVYELQPGDVGRQLLRESTRKGIFISPYQQMDDAGEDFVSVKTNPDGGCALHATWGSPGFESMLSLEQGQLFGRQQCCALLADSYEEAKTQVGDWEVLEQVSLALWSELTEPGAQKQGDAEAGIFWKTLQQGNASLATTVLHFLEQKRYDERNRI